MPFFGKIKTTILAGLTRTSDYIEDKVVSAVNTRYPDVGDVVEVLGKIRRRVDHDPGEEVDVPGVELNASGTVAEDGDGVDNGAAAAEDADSSDGKWRPGLITLGLMFKLQTLNDHTREWGWYNDKHVFLRDEEEQVKMMQVFGFYWNVMVKVSESIRTYDSDNVGSKDDQDLLRIHVKNALEFAGVRSHEEVLLAHISDKNQVEEGHCPDFALVMVHEHRQILLNICGTRMIPAPRFADVFMDLMADSVPFLRGRAHKGMVAGCVNILNKVREELNSAVANHPDYGVLVTGYSLGAGIAPLVAMQLLSMQQETGEFPEGNVVRSICYGAPPVYYSDANDDQKVPNIFLVYNNHDGLASASIETVTKMFETVRAIDRLSLGRTEMIKMLMKPIVVEETGDDLNEDDGEDSKDEEAVIDTSKLSPNWARVQEAVNSVDKEDKLGMTHFRHTAGHLYVFKRKADYLLIRKFEDTKPLSDHLRLKAGMFNQHMPWGYNSLFEGYGFSNLKVPLEDFEQVLLLQQ